MMTAQNATDNSTEPKHTDDEIRDVAAQLQEFVDDDNQLSLVCSNVYAQQVDNPMTDDYDGLTLFMRGGVGSGSTKATIIQKVLDSGVPVKLRNTSDGHGHIEFAVDL